MQRLFIFSGQIAGEKCVIQEKEIVHYIKNVLRCKMGERFVVVDEKGDEYNAQVKEISKEAVMLEIERKLPPRPRVTSVTIACAIPKNSRFDDIIDKLTQLGVDRIIPLVTERVVVRLDAAAGAARIQCWKKIAAAASQQSQRNSLPVIEAPKTFKEVLSESGEYDVKLIPTLADDRRTLKELLIRQGPRKFLILVGPEGDFSHEEVALAKGQGFIPVTLGDLVLRVETAAVAIASFIRFYENS